jgi:hypothetical protein
MAQGKSLQEIADAMRADLATPSNSRPAVKPEQFDDISKVTEAVEELTQEIRRRQESVPEINIYPAAPPVTVDTHDSTPAELKLAWKHRGLVLKVLPWIAALIAGAAGEQFLKAIGLIH